jgi:hypothetical protein
LHDSLQGVSQRHRSSASGDRGVVTIAPRVDPLDLPNAENQSVRAAVIGSEVIDLAVGRGLARALAMAYEG